MNPQLMQLALDLLVLASVVSVASSLIYFVFRVTEKVLGIGAYVISLCLSALIFLSFSSSLSRRYVLATYFFCFVFSAVGSYFHQKLTNKPKGKFASFLLMFAVTSATSILSYLLLGPFSFANSFYSEMMNKYRYLDFFVWAFLTFQSLTTPFLIWAWKTSRLRPGIDKPLSD